MDIAVLNEILAFVDADYFATSLIMDSGQRKVYNSKSKTDGKAAVLKICPIQPTAVARIKREIRILSETDSVYLPRFYFEFFITDEDIRNFIDNMNPKEHQEKIEAVKSMALRPFFITVEEYIENVPWKECLMELRSEKKLVDFLIHLFKALSVLWDKSIVHRDLKPDNILIRPNLQPVIIDLGIAKNMSANATAITHMLVPSPCTPRFAAPEQLSNNKTQVSYKADQFAVGVITFLTLTNKYPYGSDAEIGIEGVLQNCMTGKIEDLRKHNNSISEETIIFIEKLLSVQPYKRFRTTDEILNQLYKIKELL